MGLDTLHLSSTPNVLILVDPIEIKALLDGEFRLREHTDILEFRAGDTLVVENALATNETFQVSEKARISDGINTNCLGEKTGARGFSRAELLHLLADGRIKMIELNMVAADVLGLLEEGETKLDRDPFRMPQHLETLRGDDLKDYAGFYAREVQALLPRRGENGLNPLDRVLSQMRAPAENPHANHLQRGPKAGDRFEAMGSTWVVVTADFKTGTISYRKISSASNIDTQFETTFQDLSKGVETERIQGVVLNQSQNLSDVYDWMGSLPTESWVNMCLDQKDLFDYIINIGLQGLDPAKLTPQTVQAHFKFEHYVPVAPVLCDVLRQHWQTILRLQFESDAGKTLIFSYDDRDRHFQFDGNGFFLECSADGKVVSANPLSPVEIFELSLTVKSIQRTF
jgi:hypothetical protein